MCWSGLGCCGCCLWFPLQCGHLSLLSRAAAVPLESCLEQEVGGEGQAARAELLEGLAAGETGGAAAAAAASEEAAAGKPTAG